MTERDLNKIKAGISLAALDLWNPAGASYPQYERSLAVGDGFILEDEPTPVMCIWYWDLLLWEQLPYAENARPDRHLNIEGCGASGEKFLGPSGFTGYNGTFSINRNPWDGYVLGLLSLYGGWDYQELFDETTFPMSLEKITSVPVTLPYFPEPWEEAHNPDKPSIVWSYEYRSRTETPVLAYPRWNQLHASMALFAMPLTSSIIPQVAAVGMMGALFVSTSGSAGVRRPRK